METIRGVPVSDEMIQELADEAEQGYDLEKLRERGRKPIGDGPARVVPVGLDDTPLGAVDAPSQQGHVTERRSDRRIAPRGVANG